MTRSPGVKAAGRQRSSSASSRNLRARNGRDGRKLYTGGISGLAGGARRPWVGEAVTRPERDEGGSGWRCHIGGRERATRAGWRTQGNFPPPSRGLYEGEETRTRAVVRNQSES